MAWAQSLRTGDRPAALLLSRQNLPAQQRKPEQVLDIRRGGYGPSARAGTAAVPIAIGSEVAQAMAAQRLLDMRNLLVRVVSLPSSTVTTSTASCDRAIDAPRDDS